MSTIRETVGTWAVEESLDALISALELREQEKVDALSQVALQHGVQAPVLAKVLADLDLGGPRDQATIEFINAQFEAFKAEMIARFSEATGIPADLLQFPDTTPPEPTEEGL
jgi:hypothetical protein